MLRRGIVLILVLMSASMFIGLGRKNEIFRKFFYENNIEAITGGLLFVLVMFIVCFGSFYVYYLKKIKPVLKDLKNGQGICHNIVVTRKSYFENINTYYLFFDDIRLPNQQVSQADYFKYNEGDDYPLIIGMYSGIMMNEFGNFEL